MRPDIREAGDGKSDSKTLNSKDSITITDRISLTAKEKVLVTETPCD